VPVSIKFPVFTLLFREDGAYREIDMETGSQQTASTTTLRPAGFGWQAILLGLTREGGLRRRSVARSFKE